MNPKIVKICASDAAESGMKWTKNGTQMPMNSPHVEWCGYVFHGTYNPVGKDDKVTYSDSWTFRHNLGQGGTAVIEIWGNLWFKGPRP